MGFERGAMRGPKGCLAGALILAGVCLACGGGSSTAFRDGRKAELRKDWDTALIDYQKALQSQPENAQFIIHEKVARLQAAQFHLKKGRSLLASGRPDEASGEFQKAVSIDPTNQAAGQELDKLMTQIAAAKQAREKTLQEALKGREESTLASGVQLKPFPAEVMHSFKVTTDSRKAYETLAKLAGLNVAFTSDFQQRQVALDLTDVRVEDALHILALQTKTFWKAVTPNTILVIQDTPGNRRDYEDEVLKTVYLSNSLAQADRTAITTALKQILGLQKIVDNQDSNAIIIRDTPEKVAAAEKMIRDLDQGKAEIQIEVEVIEAGRDRIRDLGITPATISASGSITPGLETGVGFNPGIVPGTTTLASGISASHPGHILNYYAAVLPSAVAHAVLNDSHTHILQNPQVRVTDGQTAKVKIGSRIPYATGSFGLGGLGGTGTTGTTGSPGNYGGGLIANTQFQFEDVGVNLDLTPHLLSNGEVSIKASIEISSQGASQSVGGVNEPTFNQRKIDHIIQLKEGEVSVLGGLIESTVTHSNAGVPVLGQLPLLHYLFSSEHTERLETEVLVMLTPRVVRLPARSSEAGKGVAVSGQSGPPQPGISLPIEQQ
jgi:general secretion pathway protein D